MQTTLDKLQPGDRAIVLEVRDRGAVRRRILDMGITKNTEVVFHKVAPLGDPIDITVRGYQLTLRRAEAQAVVVETNK